MRRKATTNIRRAFIGYDIRKDTKQEHLASIGAVILAFNILEALLDSIVLFGTNAARCLDDDFASRFRGIDDKIAILKNVVRNHWNVSEPTCRMMEDTLGHVALCKKYRDAIAHARMIHPDEPVAETFRNKGEVWETIVTKDAADALYDLIDALKAELSVVTSLILSLKEKQRLLERGLLNAQHKERIAELTRQNMALYRARQKERRSLKPLPKFPDLPPQEGEAQARFLVDAGKPSE